MATTIAILSSEVMEKVGNNLRITGVFNASNKSFFINPKTYVPAGNQITSAGQLEGAKSTVDAAYFEVLAADYTDSQWTTSGWNLGNVSPQLETFATNNIAPFEGNGVSADVIILVGRKTIDGVAYTVALSYPGNVTNIVAGGLFYVFGQDKAVPEAGSPYQMLYQYPSYAVGSMHVLCLDSSGRAWAWGQNTYGALGNGVSSSAVSASPSQVVGGHSFSSIDARGYTSIGLKADGSVWNWGYQYYGGTTNKTLLASSPELVMGNHSFTQVTISGTAQNTTAYGLKSNGQVWAWGYATSGELGDNTASDKSSPVLVVGSHSFTRIEAGNLNCYGLKSNGQVWSWGDNTNGSIGDNTVTWRSSPVLVVGSHSFVNIAAGNGMCFGLKSDGRVWAWGSNSSGQLGDNSTTNKSSPVLVVGSHSFTQITGGGGAAFGLKSNGQVWAWGSNGGSQLGDGTTASRSSPVLVVGSQSFSAIQQLDSTIGAGTTIATAGSVAYSWGSDSASRRGLTKPAQSAPYTVSDLPAEASKVVKLEDSLTALTTDGSVWSMGANSTGDLGDGTTTYRNLFTKVVGGHSFSDISKTSVTTSTYATSAALKSNGQAWTWGYNGDGCLGDNTATSKSSPVLVVGSHSFTKVLAGQHMLGLKSNGQVWAWGLGTNGRLGDNTATSKSSPVLVVGSHSFIDIASCGYAGGSYGLKSNGQVWSWGCGQTGTIGNYRASTLGDNTVTSKSSPVLVVGSHSFTQIAASSTTLTSNTTARHVAIALKADGSAWTWGSGQVGQLGNGSAAISGASSPVLVVGSHSFIEVATYNGTNCYGLKSNGQVWGWGQNTSGEIGSGDLVNRSSPVLVTGASGFADLFSGAAKRTNI